MKEFGKYVIGVSTYAFASYLVFGPDRVLLLGSAKVYAVQMLLCVVIGFGVLVYKKDEE